MATLTIQIRIGREPIYSINPPLVYPGDTVVFTLEDSTDTVTVKFEEGTPFNQDDFVLNGSSTLTASKSPVVRSDAPYRRYEFKVPPPPEPWKHGEDPEPPGTVSGGVDVGTEPPILIEK
ncbi:hypothetical protein [Melittangium boletus]|nr:hypothetical protein [Melittangium boletus]